MDLVAQSKKYVHETLDKHMDRIRLLTLLPGHDDDVLQGTLTAVSLKDLEQSNISASSSNYEALSYCWGKSEELLPLQILDPTSSDLGLLLITATLHLAWRHLRPCHRPL